MKCWIPMVRGLMIECWHLDSLKKCHYLASNLWNILFLKDWKFFKLYILKPLIIYIWHTKIPWFDLLKPQTFRWPSLQLYTVCKCDAPVWYILHHDIITFLDHKYQKCKFQHSGMADDLMELVFLLLDMMWVVSGT